MIYVLGGRGRLGQAIAAAHAYGEVVLPARAVYESWWQPGAEQDVGRFFASAQPGSVVLVAAGVLDPALSEAEHQRVNVDLPLNVVDGACRAGLRVVTVGTVMERLASHANRYVAAKAKLAQAVQQRAASGLPVLHAQVHTLYGGGAPSPHMFLGQMLAALKSGQPFEMSPGQQLREYHHVEDDVAALRALIGTTLTGVVAMSHGEPCTLRDLSLHVFEDLGAKHLLRLGARPEPPDDNFATVLPRPAFLSHVEFRPALPGVALYMKNMLMNASIAHD